MVFTIFHGFPIVGGLTGLLLGSYVGKWWFGPAGGLIGAGAGAVLGAIVGSIPLRLIRWYSYREAERMSEADLRAALRSGTGLNPTFLLYELARRGADLRFELPVVAAMLGSEDFYRRCAGWAALTGAFPKEAARIPNYSPGASPEDCRRHAAVLIAEEGG